MRQFIQNFRVFIARGNVIDLAVAVIIGAAFGAITTSLVDDILMPPIGMLPGPETTGDNEVLQRKILAHGTPALVLVHTACSLDYDTAKALQNDLAELLGRYETQQTANLQHDTVRIGLAPVPSELEQH